MRQKQVSLRGESTKHKIYCFHIWKVKIRDKFKILELGLEIQAVFEKYR